MDGPFVGTGFQAFGSPPPGSQDPLISLGSFGPAYSNLILTSLLEDLGTVCKIPSIDPILVPRQRALKKSRFLPLTSRVPGLDTFWVGTIWVVNQKFQEVFRPIPFLEVRLNPLLFPIACFAKQGRASTLGFRLLLTNSCPVSECLQTEQRPSM